MPGPPPIDTDDVPPTAETTVDLVLYGWDDGWAGAFQPYAAQGLVPARVAIEYNHLLRLYTATGDVRGQHSGKLLHEAEGRQAMAAVGDWVAIAMNPGERSATIEAVLQRRSHFSRKAAGDLTEQQVVAANIDVVFIVMGLDRDYNPRRLERYLVMVSESGARPQVLLSKADLSDHVDAQVEECRAAAPGVDVYAVSVRDGRGVARVRAAIRPGQTGTLLGSSGAGKSTLINELLGHEMLATAEVRAHDSRGRHTTRHRQLVPMPGGGLLIDTPGMRELQLWTEADAPQASFEDIEALAAGCHFTNCQHLTEPRCAVREAVTGGTLDAVRLESFHKLQGEARALGAKQDVRERLKEKAASKTLSKAIRQVYRQRGRD
ncbi:MAG TPA: ribosome small subunit-dependent GTPase A [Vicinamibacterales bacterium]|nr:ribosome small subunit-dependent GTPase A [Vicinamibacterales bacterium]